MESTSEQTESMAQDNWWKMLAALYRRRIFIMAVTGFIAAASVVISLLLPVWYGATAKVIIPDGGSGGTLGALLGNLNPSAAALLGGSGGDYVRYMAILTSNSMSDRVIEEFDLMNLYETTDSKTPIRDTREELESNVEFEVDREFDYLTVSVLDQSPERSAEMANFFVDELNRINVELSTESATRYRKFVERRYDDTIAGLDSAMANMQRYQEQYGLLELEQQSQAFMEILAEYRAAAFQAEIEYEGLMLDFGEDNPMVRSARNRVEAARAKEKELLEGNDPLMPIALTEIPEIARGYATAMREVLIYEKVLEFARPLLEQAIFEEQREAPAVQVLDRASVPEWKSKPKRALIVIGATFSAFILVVLYVIVHAWLQNNRVHFSRRMAAELDTKG